MSGARKPGRHQSQVLHSEETKIWTIRLFNAHLNSLAQSGKFAEILSKIDDAQKGIIELANPLNTHTFTILLKAFGNAGNLVAARRLLDAMHSFDEGKRPNIFTYNTMLNICIRKGDMRGARQLFELLESNQIDNVRSDCITYTTMIKGYAANGDMQAADNLFKRIHHHPDSECRPTQVTYNTMMQGFVSRGDIESANRLLEQMFQDDGIPPDVVSMNTIMSANVKQRNLQRAKDWFQQMRTKEIEPNAVTYQILIEGSIWNNDMEYADMMFQDVINAKSPIILSAAVYHFLIETWLRRGNLQKAEFVFNHQLSLTKPESQPDEKTLMLVAAAYSHYGMTDKLMVVLSRITNGVNDSTPAYFEPEKKSRADSNKHAIGFFQR